MHSTIPIHQGDFFTWVRQDSYLPAVGVAESSDFGREQITSWIYHDAYDTGFYVVSHKSGNKQLFVLQDVKYTSDGDVGYWLFASVNLPTTVYIKIFND